ncbi:hypothetical protein L9F63_006505 [Diploptera punctata]|uniref:ZAD domain-containing protein n=1 Tax=Diploptera punctata TaxID=6984 RepID=A0AAD7ZB12_DIPPU|nr:hypothetical protein L9F63_006505 [Diploptera punctata]
MPLNFDKVCRLCMSQENMLFPLFKNEENLHQKVMDIIPDLLLRADDGLPRQVCSQCLQQVNSSYDFKQHCENTDTILRKLLLQMQVYNLF